MTSGYIIKKLRMTGLSVEDAEVSFTLGTNVINGPSNTGKTFIFQSINYMFGRSKPPKKIKEARPYTKLFLELYISDDISYTLCSDLKGGDIQLYTGGIDDMTFGQEFQTLSRKHNPKSEETISAFMLKLNNIYPRKIRTNAKGKTRQLSYRDVIRFLMIDEVRMITEESLIQSHYTKATEEKSALKFIISNSDDSDIVTLLSKTEITNRKGRLELLNELIIEEDYDLNQMLGSTKGETLEQIISRLEVLRTSHSELEKRYQDLNSQRIQTQKELDNFNFSKKEIEELHFRSRLLQNHYDTDIKRLKSTIEASYSLINGEEHVNTCPICKSNIPHECTKSELEEIINSCSAEIIKIEGLLIELKQSVTIMLEEIQGFSKRIKNLELQLQNIEENIETKIQKELTTLYKSIEVLNERRSSLLGINQKQERLEKYKKQKEQIVNVISTTKSGNNFISLTTANMTDVSNQIKSVLDAINYEDLSSVSYSEDEADFVISGESRALFGKGYRSIIYAAFIVALQELLFGENYSIGVPVLDSPLVTYRKPNSNNEEIPMDLAMDFYRYLANNKLISQILIIENEAPPIDILNKINHIEFTGLTTTGRYGFVPT